MIRYSREVPDDVEDFDSALLETVDHVRAHLSACADVNDSEDAFYSHVDISYSRLDAPARTRVTGALDVEPCEYALDELPAEPLDGECYVSDDGEGELR